MSYEDRIYHSGYLDGYYASMELYHSDEMTDEEKIQKALEEDRKARRKRRRRNFAIRTAIGLGLSGVGAYAYNKAKEAERAERDASMNRSMNDLNDWVKTVRSTMRKSAPKRKRNIPGFRKSTGTYKVPNYSEHWIPFSVARDRKLKRNKPTYASDELDELDERIKRGYENMKKKYYDPNTGHWRWRTKH